MRYCQFLDVYIFRQCKLFARRLEEYVRCEVDYIQNLHNRIFIMQMPSFIYNRLCFSKYVPMVKYAWQAEERLPNDSKVNFSNVFVNFAHIQDIMRKAVKKDSLIMCELHIYFVHSVLSRHYHEEEYLLE